MVVQRIPTAGSTNFSVHAVEVQFSENVTGVDAGDLLVNEMPAEEVEMFGAAHYVFSFSQPATGWVHFAWAPQHGIQDAEMNPFVGEAWSVILDPRWRSLNVVISEFMAANSGSTNDTDGDSSDWIEIFNMEQFPVNLEGWFLTDSTNNLTRWRLPNYTLAARGLLLIWASEKNRTNAATPLHTNFKLDKSGEYLALVGPDTNVVSEFAPRFPEQEDDVSFGRDPLDPAFVGHYVVPSPGRLNTTGGAGSFAPDVVFSTNSGTFVQPFALTLGLKTPLSNAVIRYALGTNVPGSNSPLYTAPIGISNTVQVRARAFAPGHFPGAVHSEQFVELSPNVLHFKSDLPLVILHNNGGGAIPANADQYVMLQTFEVVNGESSLTNVPAQRAQGIFHKRGSSTLTLAKSSFFFEARDELDDDKDEALLGLPADSDWVLYAPNEFDPPMIHNPVGYELARQTGRYASRTRFVVVFLKNDASAGRPINIGDYNGIYVLEEKVKLGNDRVDIAKLEANDSAAPNVTGGYLLSIDRVAPGENKFTAAGQPMNYIDPKYAEITAPQRDAQQQYIIGYFNQFGAVLDGAGWTNPVSGYAAYIDVDSWIDYSLNGVVTRNIDATLHSTFLYKPRNGKIHFGPMWDCDRSQGGADGRDFNPRVWNCGTSANYFGYSWWGRLFTDPNFWQRWIDRYQGLRRDVFSNTNVYRIIDNYANEVRMEHPNEVTRWGSTLRTGVVAAVCPNFSHNFGAGSFQAEINWMKIWYSNRFDFMDKELLSPPVLSRAPGMISTGATLSITAPAGATVYYTLDGTDPRALHGGIASNALVYAGSITLTSSVRVVARCRNLNHRNETGGKNPPISSPWSGPAAATYYVQIPPLIVSELMYHPDKPPLPDRTDADEFEFIELRNIGVAPVHLVGVRFTNGIDFTFTATNGVTQLAPGGFVVVVKNLAAFATRYPNVTNVVGEFNGNLENGGERIALIGALGEPIADFVYDDAWHPETDGDGPSLVLVNQSAVPATYSTSTVWRASSMANGSPGAGDGGSKLQVQRAGANIVLNWAASGAAVLTSTTNLGPPITWLALPGAATNGAGQMSVTSPMVGPRRFFRLE
jgi:hypothetical protein